MAETHAGITNENSFFSEHGLLDMFGASRQGRGLVTVSISLILVQTWYRHLRQSQFPACPSSGHGQ